MIIIFTSSSLTHHVFYVTLKLDWTNLISLLDITVPVHESESETLRKNLYAMFLPDPSFSHDSAKKTKTQEVV